MIIKSSIDVCSSDIFVPNSDTFHPLGLFSEQIFGPKSDYECQCGKLSGVHNLGKRCPECNVLIGPSTLRRYIISHIRFPISIVHPLVVMFMIPQSITQELQQKVVSPTLSDKLRAYIEKNRAKFDSFVEKFGSIYVDNIVVLPPALRPISRVGKQIREMDKLNHFYLVILNLLAKGSSELTSDNLSSYTSFLEVSLLKHCVGLYRYTIQLLSKKEGVIRQNILGKRNDFTGRAVIVPDPTLKLGEARISYRMLCHLLEPFVVFELSQIMNPIDAHECVSKYVQNPYILPQSTRVEIERVLDRICKYKLVMLNRQPTLHRVSIESFRPMGTRNDVIAIPLAVCVPYNADFDGDTMACYVPLTHEAHEECMLMNAANQLNHPGSLEVKSVTQDLVLGLWYATKEILDNPPIENPTPNQLKQLHPHTRVKIDGRETSAGRAYISSVLGVEINFVLTKKKIQEVLTQLSFTDTNIDEIIDELVPYVLPFTTQFTISLEDILLSTTGQDWKEKYRETKKWNVSTLKQFVDDSLKAMKSIKLSENISALITSGARGSLDQWSQIVMLRGLIRNPQGKLVLPPILSSLAEGYSPTEIVLSSVGSRKGIVDKALNTATAGYLTRKLVFSLQHLVVTDEDCNTSLGLDVTLTPENYKEYLFRYTVDGEFLDYETIQSKLGQTVTLRSPIYCKSRTLCKKCYPYTDVYNSGFAGIIAAQSIGEVGTQLTMRTFHTGGAATTKQIDIPEDVLHIDENDVVYSKLPLRVLNDDQLPLDPNDILTSDSTLSFCTDDDVVYNVLLPQGTKWLVKSSTKKISEGTPLFKIVIRAEDLATDLVYVNHMLSSRQRGTLEDALAQMDRLKAIYKNYQSLLSVHFEVLWSERLRTPDGTSLYRLTVASPNKEDSVLLESVTVIPYQRLLLGLCYEDFRKYFRTNLSAKDFDLDQLSPIECLIQSNLKILKSIYRRDV